MKVVMVVGPYRGPDHEAVYNNIQLARSIAIEIWRMGAACICPHLNSAFFSGATDESNFLNGYLEILKRCDAIYLAPGFSNSDGAKKEVALADELGLKTFFNLGSLSDWLSNE